MIRKLLACRRGAVSVEAAFIMPVLIFLLLGILEFGLLIFTYSSLQNASREVTRQIAVNYTKVADAKAEVTKRLPGWARTGLTVTVTQTNAGDRARNVFTLVATLPAVNAAPIAFYTKMGKPWTLSTQVAMKQERHDL